MTLLNKYRRFTGFTLIELLIVIAIIGILLATAVPAYQSYILHAKFVELKHAALPFKKAMEIAVLRGGITGNNTQNIISNLTGGTLGIPADITDYESEYIDSITTESGVITVTGKNFPAEIADGSPTYKITAQGISQSGNIIYDNTTSDEVRGTCFSAGLCD